MQEYTQESKLEVDEARGHRKSNHRRFVFTKLGFSMIVGFFGILAGLISAILVLAVVFSPNYSTEDRTDARTTRPSADKAARDRAHGVMLDSMAMMEDQVRGMEGLETDLDQSSGHNIFNSYPVEELVK